MKSLRVVFLLSVVLALSCSAARSQTIVTFPDPNLEAVVRETLNKPTGNLTTADLQTLTDLYAWSRNITNLSGLEWATHLQSLELGQNLLSNARPIRNLTQLTYLGISGNHFHDLTDLLTLTNLQNLSVGGNIIWDYSPLCSLRNLQWLLLDNAYLSDLSFIACLTNLTFLALPENQITNIAAIVTLTNLQALDLNDNPVINFAGLSTLPNLGTLNIGNEAIANLDWLPSLRNLKSFGLSRGSISNGCQLASLTNLTSLSLNQTPITNYSCLITLTNLRGLTLSSKNITNIDFISSMTRLTSLYISYTRVTDLCPIAGLTNLYSVLLHYNRLTNISALTGLTNLLTVYLQGNLLDLGPSSAAMNVITNLQAYVPVVTYLPQNQPAYLLISTNWFISSAHPASLLFQTFDDEPYTAPLLVTATSANTALLSQLTVNADGSTSDWKLKATPNQTGTTTITLTVTDEDGLTTNANILVTIGAPVPLDGQILNAPAFSWVSGGTPPWSGETNVTHDGILAAQSGGPGSWLETTVSGPGTFSFWYKSSPGGPLLTGLCPAQGLSAFLWLDNDDVWHQKKLSIPPGAWTLCWNIYADVATQSISNTLWLDQVSFSAGTPTFSLELVPDPPSFGVHEIFLAMHGEPNTSYTLEISSDLQHWSTLSTSTITSFEQLTWDPNWRAASRFYRMRKVFP